MERETLVPDINPSSYKHRNTLNKMDYFKPTHKAPQTNLAAPQKPFFIPTQLLLVALALLIFGFVGFAWKYHKLGKELERLSNQMELIHQRLPLADQITNQDQFEQNYNQKIEQIEKRFAEIMKSSNEIITTAEHAGTMDLTKEVEHLQQLTSENMDKLNKLEQQIQLLSNQQNTGTNHSNTEANKLIDNQ